MAGAILSEDSFVTCVHGGVAEPVVPDPMVLVGGAPLIAQDSPYIVSGCCFPPPVLANGPCVCGEWVLGDVTVLAGGIPVLVQAGVAVCELTGTGLLPEVCDELIQTE